MNLSTAVLGSTVVKTLNARTAAPVLTIGRDRFTRGDLAAVACFNFIAAASLSRAVEDLGVASTRDLFERIAPSALALPGVGAIALAVLGACFEKHKLGGDAPLEQWMKRHAGNVPHAVVTFASVKHRLAADDKRERRDKRARKHARRDTAHRLRVDRHLSRRTSESPS